MDSHHHESVVCTAEHILRVMVTALFITLNSPFIPIFSQIQTGTASYYTRQSAGKTTASGERLNNDSLTCAHRIWPFGTYLHVTNLSNGCSVIVRVNDRGPYISGRIIDLSWAAACAIKMISQGTAKVTVEPAYSITVPLKPSPMKFELPQIRSESLELPDTLRAIWQEDELIVHKKKKMIKKER